MTLKIRIQGERNNKGVKMKWNHTLFLKNIDYLVSNKFETQDKLNAIVGRRDAVTLWKKGNKPSLDNIMILAKVTVYTIDELISQDISLIKKEKNVPESLLEVKALLKSLQIQIAGLQKQIDTQLSKNKISKKDYRTRRD
jgi:hypothetical protein